MNVEYIPTDLTISQIKALEPRKVRLSSGKIVDGSFAVVGENNQGKQIVIEYTEAASTGVVVLKRSHGAPLHRPQIPVTRTEFEKSLKDPHFEKVSVNGIVIFCQLLLFFPLPVCR